MSAAKRKITQSDLRLLMQEKKRKLLDTSSTSRKVESPLAKYRPDGTLTCILCNSTVKNESIWNIHIVGKQHRENIAKRKQSGSSVSSDKSDVPTSNTVFKRPLDKDVTADAPKKLKSILKNKSDPSIVTSLPLPSSAAPEDAVPNKLESGIAMEVDTEDAGGVDPISGLPEGFFDDPKLDAKVRNVEYKDPVEEEWKKFQEEIREESLASMQLQGEEHEMASIERNIENIEEQIQDWSRILSLEVKREELQEVLRNQRIEKNEDEDSSYGSDEEEQLEEFLDWRKKRSFI